MQPDSSWHLFLTVSTLDFYFCFPKGCHVLLFSPFPFTLSFPDPDPLQSTFSFAAFWQSVLESGAGALLDLRLNAHKRTTGLVQSKASFHFPPITTSILRLDPEVSNDFTDIFVDTQHWVKASQAAQW